MSFISFSVSMLTPKKAPWRNFGHLSHFRIASPYILHTTLSDYLRDPQTLGTQAQAHIPLAADTLQLGGKYNPL